MRFLFFFQCLGEGNQFSPGTTTPEGLDLFLAWDCRWDLYFFFLVCGEHDLTEEILTIWKMYRICFKEQLHCSTNGLLLWSKTESQTVAVCACVCTSVSVHSYMQSACVFEYFCICVNQRYCVTCSKNNRQIVIIVSPADLACSPTQPSVTGSSSGLVAQVMEPNMLL